MKWFTIFLLLSYAAHSLVAKERKEKKTRRIDPSVWQTLVESDHVVHEQEEEEDKERERILREEEERKRQKEQEEKKRKKEKK